MRKEMKYYMSANSPGIFYRSYNINPELAFADACYEIADKKIIDWLSKQEFRECLAYPGSYSTNYLDDIFPFATKLVKCKGEYMVVEY